MSEYYEQPELFGDNPEPLIYSGEMLDPRTRIGIIIGRTAVNATLKNYDVDPEFVLQFKKIFNDYVDDIVNGEYYE